jgi:hydroxymethylpyrimidine pyrophosphatase-like HAD family hydrolase
MQRIVFVDLDDTLFQTERKNPRADRLAAVGSDGKPLSFRCGRQEAFLDWLTKDAAVVPVTGRNVDAFRRVTIPFEGQVICSFGGVILGSDGEPDSEWHARMEEASRRTEAVMDGLLCKVGKEVANCRVDVRYRIVRDAGLPLYVSVKHNAGSAQETARLAAAVSPAAPEGWTIHLNGSNMALLPPFLGKAQAVGFFMKRFVGNGPVLTVGVGDSLTDLGFMELCDYVIAPARSQILSFLLSQTPVMPAAWGGRT